MTNFGTLTADIIVKGYDRWRELDELWAIVTIVNIEIGCNLCNRHKHINSFEMQNIGQSGKRYSELHMQKVDQGVYSECFAVVLNEVKRTTER